MMELLARLFTGLVFLFWSISIAHAEPQNSSLGSAPSSSQPRSIRSLKLPELRRIRERILGYPEQERKTVLRDLADDLFHALKRLASDGYDWTRRLDSDTREIFIREA